MTIPELERELGSASRLGEALQVLRQAELVSHLQRYWRHVWDCGSAGLFVLPEQHYNKAKLNLDRLTNRTPEYDPLEAAGEEGSSRRLGNSLVVLLPQATWDAFIAGDKQKSATVVHEITHVEDSLINGAILEERALFAVWQEFFAETVAARFYDSAMRSKDLNAGMHMAAQNLLGFPAGISQFGRFLGFLNGWSTPAKEVADLFEVFGEYWQAAAANSFPVLGTWAENERRPDIRTLEKILGPLFG